MGKNSDPWQEERTIHNLAAEEVISALQKEIRRGHAENSALLAYEMTLTSPELEEKLWKCLLVISAEDIGFGEPRAAILIKALFELHLQYLREEQDRYLFAIRAVRFLCGCEKDRSNDELLNLLMKVDGKPEIPDYAIDMHARRGKSLGRGLQHFLEEGALVSPEKEGREDIYRERLLKLLEKE
ncbi:MAG TPA: hypothetical protein DF984_03820 [Anaerolineaceae bacterium]|nr:hypothetical protein [Anaerolineaceae bacterium]